MKTVFEIFAMIFSSVLSFILGVASVLAVGLYFIFTEQEKGNLTITRNAYTTRSYAKYYRSGKSGRSTYDTRTPKFYTEDEKAEEKEDSADE